LTSRVCVDPVLFRPTFGATNASLEAHMARMGHRAML
jgi:hypothetical protein